MIAMLTMPPPKTAHRAMASTTCGMTRMASAILLMTSSTNPPKKPAIIPRVVPMTQAMATASTPTIRETWLP